MLGSSLSSLVSQGIPFELGCPPYSQQTNTTSKTSRGARPPPAVARDAVRPGGSSLVQQFIPVDNCVHSAIRSNTSTDDPDGWVS
ncbi:hypothetical protein THAOC_28879 [Thalassiosira oceanica]|uniref:Uncharacterized protein n=1 Tax=Thalassiosira oceanica TaxID=159749 RepID=K0RF82_THAOC|nr:hypothetical protein THAOC_28879 [Thalassiosira oceanica]|eukprot:EJK51905.1 hypothetical protein THAOC_28879 [Thalassiosira oceanica]